MYVCMYGPNRLHRAGILHAPAPAMGAFAGYGLAVHDGKLSGPFSYYTLPFLLAELGSPLSALV